MREKDGVREDLTTGEVGEGGEECLREKESESRGRISLLLRLREDREEEAT